MCDETQHDEVQEKVLDEVQVGITKLETDETSERFVITNLHITILSILLLISTSFCVFHLYASKVTAPIYIAEKYITAKSTQDYSTMQQFFEPELFDTDYKGAYEQEILDITLNDLSIYSEYSGSDYIDYSYSYYTNDDAQLRGGDVSLLLLPEKKWFLYDNWIVDPEYAILTDVRVKMTKPISATIGSMDLRSIATKVTENEDGTVIYTLPNLLRGDYNVTVSYPFSDNVLYTLDVDYESINNFIPTLSSEQSLELTQMAEDTLNHIYNKDFSSLTYGEIKDKLALTTPNYFSEEQYAIKLQTAYSDVEFSDYTLSNIKTSMSILMSDDDGIYTIFASINGDVHAKGISDSSTDVKDYSGEILDYTVYFEFDGSSWVMADIKPVYPL